MAKSKKKLSAKKKLPEPPKFYSDFLKKYPEIGSAYEKMGDAVHSGGPLTARERALVKLAISGSHLFHSAFKSHIRKAIAAGISRDEIEHIALLTLPTVGFPTMMAMMGIIEDQISTPEEHKKKR